MICNIKSLDKVHIGDTVSVASGEPAEKLAGYQEPKRMVFCGLYPSDGQDFKQLREALDKLVINDPSFEFSPETSDALGFGFRCGFLGLLHMEIVQQRLEQEADIDLVQTAPNVTYEIVSKSGETMEVHTPQDVPDPGDIEEFRQPIVRVSFVRAGRIYRRRHEDLQPTDAAVFLRSKNTCRRRGRCSSTTWPWPTSIYDMHDKP